VETKQLFLWAIVFCKQPIHEQTFPKMWTAHQALLSCLVWRCPVILTANSLTPLKPCLSGLRVFAGCHQGWLLVCTMMKMIFYYFQNLTWTIFLAILGHTLISSPPLKYEAFPNGPFTLAGLGFVFSVDSCVRPHC
jgi:hypothetical protein